MKTADQITRDVLLADLLWKRIQETLKWCGTDTLGYRMGQREILTEWYGAVTGLGAVVAQAIVKQEEVARPRDRSRVVRGGRSRQS